MHMEGSACEPRRSMPPATSASPRSPTRRSPQPTDAIVKVMAGCICGSDLWPYRGENDITPGDTIGHECVGVVEEVGSEVTRSGPATSSSCRSTTATTPARTAGPACSPAASTSASPRAARRSTPSSPRPTGSLVKTDGMPDDVADPVAAHALRRDGDRLARGGRGAGSSPGGTAVVVGDGAVGLCGVLAAAQLGAEQVIAMSRHEPRQEIARQFGATHIVAERGEEGAAADQGDHRGRRGGRGARVRRHRPGDEDRVRRRPPRRDRRLRRRAARRGAAGAPDVPEERRPGRRDGAGARVPARAARPASSRHHRPRPGLRPRRCRWTRSPRATGRWTSGGRSRS